MIRGKLAIAWGRNYLNFRVNFLFLNREFLQPNVPSVLLLNMYRYSVNSAICRPSDRIVGRPQAENRTRDGQSSGRNTLTIRQPHLLFRDFTNVLDYLRGSGFFCVDFWIMDAGLIFRVAGVAHFWNFRLRLQLQTNSNSYSYPYPYP